ncbi:MAG: DUF87 domain-containing protein [Myxococcota bacterium]
MDYEKLGAFYLGRVHDLATGETTSETLLYDAKDLTTHAVIIGMTGSGKTGLGIDLLEEALIDGIPVIAIDPKGDLGNMLLAFPDLAPGDFRPWIDEAEAARKGRTADEHAKATAELWRDGLARWDQPPERIRRYVDACERAIYTPGSTAGRPIAVLRSLAAPGPAVMDDADALRERIGAAAASLLGLLGVDADPLRSREHILLSTLLQHAWTAGRDLDLPTLIAQIQSPPVQRVGVLELDSFYPPADRFELAMTLNNLLASPGFDAWTQGEPLDVARLLYGEGGRPRLSVLSLSHLSESERMFFVTLLLTEVVAWMRAQPGSSSLRAILYMDEVFGYFPPTANPPSKTPMLTLLKQARAYGLGCVLSTQNPVDLDYKGLGNTGTWFLGRLQAERDKQRVLEGLEGAAATASGGFDRARMERTLAGLGSRVFVMNNVHDDGPVVFETRWAMSYLAGPLARDQIKRLAGDGGGADRSGETRPARAPAAAEASVASAARAPAASQQAEARPVLPPEVREAFLPVTRPPAAHERLVYRPALAARAALRHANASAGIDLWRELALLAPLDDDTSVAPWAEAAPLGRALPELAAAPVDGAAFAPLPPDAARARSYASWGKQLATQLYREHPLVLWKCAKPRAVSEPGETLDDFRGRLRGLVREQRDLEVEKLRARFAPKLARVQDRIARAEQRVEVEKEQYEDSKRSTWITAGTTLVGALFGRKLGSATNVGRAASVARGASRAARDRGDIARAEDRADALRDELRDLETEFQEAVAALEEPIAADDLDVEELRIAPRKSDVAIEELLLVWTPWRVDATGIATPAFETPAAPARA